MVARKRTRKDLSEAQRKILSVIHQFWEEKGYAPSVRELLEKANISSTSVVEYYLKQLEERGLIQREGRVSRSIRLTKPLTEIFGSTVQQVKETLDQTRSAVQDILSIPILGRIVASSPVPIPSSDFAYFDSESSIEIARSMLPEREKGDDLFALEVQGDSMIDAMINDGDLVIMKKVREVKNGEMVAVWLRNQDETTLKYFFREGNRVRLQPANPTMSPIYIDDPSIVEVQGKVVMVIRQVDMLH